MATSEVDMDAEAGDPDGAAVAVVSGVADGVVDVGKLDGVLSEVGVEAEC